MDRALRWFVRGWLTLFIVINVISVIGFFIGAPSFWAGWHRMTEIYSPFNLWNYAAELVLISPAFAAYLLLERRKKHATKPTLPMTPQEAQQIINVYGAANEKPSAFPRKLYNPSGPQTPAGQKVIDEVNALNTSLRDISTLPYPKERIKQALLIGIALTTGADREHLRTGYVLLGDWQDPTVPDPMAAMVAEGKALLAELKAFEEKLAAVPGRPEKTMPT